MSYDVQISINDNLQKDLGVRIKKEDNKLFLYKIAGKIVYINAKIPFIATMKSALEKNVDFCLITKMNDGYCWIDKNTLKEITKNAEDKAIEDAKDIKRTDTFGKTVIVTQYSNNVLLTNNYDELLNKIRKDLEMDTLNEQLKDLILKADAKQIICHGAPGTGKTYTIENLNDPKTNNKIFAELKYENGKIIDNFVQFHPSYDYTDFVEGLRPVEIDGQTTFVRMDGIFKKFCREVVRKNEPDKKYLFIIDEINRADLSKVFGELMYCFEDSKRDKKIATQYSNLTCYEIKQDTKQAVIIKDDCFADGFYIPENVIVIGTMNDIDRSVESFDFALQRRFQWIHVKADYEMTVKVLSAVMKENYADNNDKEREELANKLITHAKALNNQIADKSLGLGVDYEIGQAYYKKFASYYKRYDNDYVILKEKKEVDIDSFNNALKDVWNYSLKSILTSYLRGKKDSKTLEDFYQAFTEV